MPSFTLARRKAMLTMRHLVVGLDGWTQCAGDIQQDEEFKGPAEAEVNSLALGEYRLFNFLGIETQVRYEAAGVLSGAVRIHNVIATTFLVLLGKNPTAERLLLHDMHEEMGKRFGGEVQEDILIFGDRPLLITLQWFVVARDHHEDIEKLGKEVWAKSGLAHLQGDELVAARIQLETVLGAIPLKIAPALALALLKSGK